MCFRGIELVNEYGWIFGCIDNSRFIWGVEMIVILVFIRFIGIGFGGDLGRDK